jgi:hypothetical protein
MDSFRHGGLSGDRYAYNSINSANCNGELSYLELAPNQEGVGSLV